MTRLSYLSTVDTLSQQQNTSLRLPSDKLTLSNGAPAEPKPEMAHRKCRFCESGHSNACVAMAG